MRLDFASWRLAAAKSKHNRPSFIIVVEEGIHVRRQCMRG